MAMRGPPSAIGRYEVERLLGQGGMGVVWLARDTVLGRRVAIKVLRDDLALAPRVKEELVERMRHEARAAAAVSHPNIVTLYDMGEDRDVGLYLVFEYVPGPAGEPESLRDRLRNGPLTLQEVGSLARELGSALTFAHEAGVIHRDIKPENVLFSRTGAKIADFGIARIPESTITRQNTVLGTPAYTSPEALSTGAFGPKSDQFALAATLYEAAAGARAFAGSDPIQTAGKVSSEPPPPLDGSLGPAQVLRGLGDALNRGLAKDAEQRFETCAALGEAVELAIDRAPPSHDSGKISIDTVSGRIEIERTPLSSRMALVERATRMASERPLPIPTPYGETPAARLSIQIRKKTQRVQNVVAAVALLVIIVLVLMGGRRSSDDAPASRDGAKSAAAAVSATAPAGAGAAAANAQRALTPKPRVHASASTETEAGAPAAAASASSAASD